MDRITQLLNKKNLDLSVFVSFFYVLFLLAAPIGGYALSDGQRQAIDAGALYVNTEEDLSCSSIGTSGSGSNKVYVIGDSLTVGMNNEGLGENTLQNQLVEAGWSPTINAQGCRPLYNATSPDGFDGNGTGCPNAIITSAFNEFEKDKGVIKTAGTVVIALGTNTYEGSEEVFIQKAVEYIGLVKAENPGVGGRIFWVNTHATNSSKDARSDSISEVVAQTGIQLIDYHSAANTDPEKYSYPSNDDVHNDANGYINKTKLIVESLGVPTAQGSVGGYDALSLTYPNFPDEQAIVDGINRTVANRSPGSKWNGLGQFIVDRSKASNVNPLFVVASGGTESGFLTSGRGVPNNNSFGIEKGNKYFDSVEEGIQYFIDRIPRNLSGENLNAPRYKYAKSIYDYFSVHQTGGIYYPNINEEQSPEPDTGPPMPILDSTESGGMGVYVSWDITDHPNDRYDGNIYNPLAYYKLNIGIINEVTGLSIPDTPSLDGYNINSGCNGIRSAVAGANGWDLPGEGENSMVYYSQIRDGSDPAVLGYYGNDPYGDFTISECGCGPTSFAMIVSTLTGNQVTPTEMAAWSAENGGQQSTCGSNWWWEDQATLTESSWGVKSRRITLIEAEAELRKGNLIIVSVGPGSVLLSPGGSGHLLVMRAVTNDGKYLFADPSDSNSKRNAYGELTELGSSRTPLDAATVSNGLKALFVVEKL